MTLVQTLRPKQWTKNLLVLLPLFFTVNEAWDLDDVSQGADHRQKRCRVPKTRKKEVAEMLKKWLIVDVMVAADGRQLLWPDALTH